MTEKDLSKLPYTEWLEDTLHCLVDFPVKSILLCAVADTGDVFKDSYKLDVGDKDRIVGLLQRENTVAFMINNKLIKNPDEE